MKKCQINLFHQATNGNIWPHEVSCAINVLNRVLIMLLLVAATAASGLDRDFKPHSKWDENLLKIELHNVRIKADNMTSAWQAISTTYLLRANFYRNAVSDEDSAHFAFNKDKATEGELIEAFIATYPEYTYTQDKETGIIWIHGKNLDYNDISIKR